MKRTKKEEATEAIAKMMVLYGIADSDIAKCVHPSKLIDLAVKSKSGIVRASFGQPYEEAIGQNRGEDIYREVSFDDYVKNVVGIFPIKGCDHWLSSKEEYLRGDQVEYNQIPKLRYWEIIHKILPSVNEVLVKLGAPKVEGYYLARPDHEDDAYLVVELFEGKSLNVHYANKHTPAKYRGALKT